MAHGMTTIKGRMIMPALSLVNQANPKASNLTIHELIGVDTEVARDMLEWVEVDFMTYLMAFASVILGTLIVGVNILTIITIKRTPSLQTLSNIYVVSLAVVDLIVGIGAQLMGFYIVKFHLLQKSENLVSETIAIQYKLCFLTVSFLIGAMLISVLHLMFISIDRFVYISSPYFYSIHINRNRIICVIMAVWVLGLTVSILPPATTTVSRRGCEIIQNMPIPFTAFLCVLFVSSSCVTIVMYAAILHTAWTQRQRIHHQKRNLISSYANYEDNHSGTRSSRRLESMSMSKTRAIESSKRPSKEWAISRCDCFAQRTEIEQMCGDLQFNCNVGTAGANDDDDCDSHQLDLIKENPAPDAVKDANVRQSRDVSSKCSQLIANAHSHKVEKPMKSIRFFMTVSCVFVVCISPAGISEVISFFKEIPMYVEHLCFMLALANSAANFFILYSLNSKFRKAVIRTLKLVSIHRHSSFRAGSRTRSIKAIHERGVSAEPFNHQTSSTNGSDTPARADIPNQHK